MAATSLIPFASSSTGKSLNKNSSSLALLKSIILAGLWPNVARVHLPKSAIKFDKVQAGTVQRENTAKEFKTYDLKEARVFIHPASICFENAAWKSGILAYFSKFETSKVFLKDVTEV
jgi:ATP-dependent RNA helicase DHX57